MLDSETCPNSDGKISRSQGTPAFTAPETGSGSFMAYPIDVWAMGVTLYMMVTGICPFAGQGIYDTYDKIQKYDPPIPQDIDSEMKDFMERIMLKDPEKRITLKQAMVHNWITKNGSEPLQHPNQYKERKFEKRVSVTKMDIEYAVSLPSDTITHLRKASMDKKAMIASLNQIENDTDNDNDDVENENENEQKEDITVFDLPKKARFSVDLMEQKEEEFMETDTNEPVQSESDVSLAQRPQKAPEKETEKVPAKVLSKNKESTNSSNPSGDSEMTESAINVESKW